MNKNLLIVLIFVILSLSVLTSGCIQQGQNTTKNDTIQNTTQSNIQQNDTAQENMNVSGATKGYDAIITQRGPTAPQKRGTHVTIHYAVTNNGKNAIYNAKVGGQNLEEKNIGTLNPGQTKKYTYTLYIPTNEDLAYIGGNVKVTSPLVVGGPKLTFKDDKGVFHSIRSNQISIKLK